MHTNPAHSIYLITCAR